jgi:hypothetical protein
MALPQPRPPIGDFGAHGVVYDTAPRGVHHQPLLRELGLLPINRVAAAHAGSKLPRRADRRVEKSAHIEDNPAFARLYPRRNDSESINRNLEDTLWIGRAHSVGHARQHLNLLGYALMVNGLALHRHHRHRTKLAA